MNTVTCNSEFLNVFVLAGFRSFCVAQLHSVCERCSFILPQGDRGDRGPRGLSGSPGPVGPAGAKVCLNAGLSVRVSRKSNMRDIKPSFHSNRRCEVMLKKQRCIIKINQNNTATHPNS